MKVERLVKVTIGESVHELTIEQAGELAHQLREYLPIRQISDFAIDAILGRPQIVDHPQFPMGGENPLHAPRQPYRVYPPVIHCKTDTDGSPI